MKKISVYILNILSKIILKKYKPVVIGITGSVGKTSAKEAIFAVLNKRFSVRRSVKNYNNEFGVPFTIIGVSSPGRNILKWFWIFLKAKLMIILPVRYPKILVIEMGADHPGDIQMLVDLVKPTIGVITAIAPVHTEFLKDIKGVAKEKGTLARSIPYEGTLILNFDDNNVKEFAEKAKSKVIGYGISKRANVEGSDIKQTLSRIVGEDGGIYFKVSHDGSNTPIHIPNVLGESHVRAALAAVSVGVSLGMHMIEISESIMSYIPPPGRMHIIPGVKNTIIVDDSYNSSPKAAVAAVQALGKLEIPANNKKYAVLADMLELGPLIEQGHRDVGIEVAKYVDVLIGVGGLSKFIIDGAIDSGMNEDNVFHFNSVKEGLEHFLQDRIRPGDILLIKGSQSMRMEKIVKGLMAEPLKAKSLLCRQGKEWL